MSIGVRNLTVLGEFKPFGLIAEALDGKPPDNLPDKYDYFLFDPELVRDRAESDQSAIAGGGGGSGCEPNERCDDELFVRGDRIIWTTGSRVFKRFTLPSPVITACWCRFGEVSEALLCVLQMETLTIYNTSGEVVSIPVPRTITSIWPLPFGLLLHAIEGNSPTNFPFASSSSPVLAARDISRTRREIGHSPQHNHSFPSAYNHIIKGDMSSMSSHLILSDLLEEPQCTYIEERGKLNIMKDFDERTIWTSDQIPLMASYNKGKMQHSVWVAEVINSNLEVRSVGLIDRVPAGVLPKQFSFRRIWHWKGAKTAASKALL